MRKSLNDFDPQEILSHLEVFSIYDRDRGAFIRTRFSNGPKVNQILGQPVGCDDGQGYLRVSLCNTKFRIHTLIWLKEYGTWPDKSIDHEDGDTNNNHISNLRCGGQLLNTKNSRAKSNNTTGYVGVSYSSVKNKYRAEVTVNYEVVYSKWFNCPHEAAKARQEFVDQHPEFGFTKRHGT